MTKALIHGRDHAHLARRFAWLLALLACWPTTPLYAFQARILLVKAPGVPARVIGNAAGGLSVVGELADAEQYLSAAADAHLAPHSIEALTRIAPGIHARLIVVLTRSTRGRLAVSYRDGYSGQVLLSVSVPVHHQALAPADVRMLASQAEAALAMQERTQPRAEPVAPSADVNESVEQPPPPQDAEEPTVELIAPQAMVAGNAEAAPATFAAASGEPSMQRQSDADQVAPPHAANDRLVARVGCGVGLSERVVRVPSLLGERNLDTALFPALDLFIRGDAPLGRHAVLGLHLHYQTSVGLVAAELPMSASTGSTSAAATATEKTSLRSHRLDFGLVPGVRFVPSDNAVTLGLFVGWGFRGLRSVMDLNLPAYMLHGLVLRPEIRIPIADGLFALRLAPELFMVAFASGALRHVSGSAASGIAWGVEASLEVRLSELIYVVPAYRESRASFASSWASKLTDVERFATLSAALRY